MLPESAHVFHPPAPVPLQPPHTVSPVGPGCEAGSTRVRHRCGEMNDRPNECIPAQQTVTVCLYSPQTTPRLRQGGMELAV